MEEDNEIEIADFRQKNEDAVTRTSRKKNGKPGWFVSKPECSTGDASKSTSLLGMLFVLLLVFFFKLYLQERLLLFNWFI